MKSKHIIRLLNKLNKKDILEKESLPHCSNIMHQLGKENLDETFYTELLKHYLEIRKVKLYLQNVDEEDKVLKDFIYELVEKTNLYYTFVSSMNISHQSDFKSSIIPEMLCKILQTFLHVNNNNLKVSAQRDLIIECTYDLNNGDVIVFKNKKVDVAVFDEFDFKFGDNVNLKFPIPIWAIECKTNLDKNMLSGIQFSSQELKKTFPRSKYFVITEFTDFDLNANYADSDIDEIYCLRNQTRNEYRKNKSIPNPLNADLVYEIALIFWRELQQKDNFLDTIKNRMLTGKLIG